jgi:hypothetical protein
VEYDLSLSCPELEPGRLREVGKKEQAKGER